MKIIVIHCPECEEPKRHLVERNGSCICLTCAYVKYTRPIRYLKDEE